MSYNYLKSCKKCQWNSEPSAESCQNTVEPCDQAFSFPPRKGYYASYKAHDNDPPLKPDIARKQCKRCYSMQPGRTEACLSCGFDKFVKNITELSAYPHETSNRYKEPLCTKCGDDGGGVQVGGNAWSKNNPHCNNCGYPRPGRPVDQQRPIRACSMCGYWHDYEAESCPRCASIVYEEEGRLEVPEEKAEISKNISIKTEDSLPYCTYLMDNHKMCGANKKTPCGRHSSDKQKLQETRLKEMALDAFNDIHRSNYSIADLGVAKDASAFEFLRAAFYYLDVNEDRITNSPYIGRPIGAEERHDHSREDNWITSTYDYSQHCRYCKRKRE